MHLYYHHLYHLDHQILNQIVLGYVNIDIMYMPNSLHLHNLYQIFVVHHRLQNDHDLVIQYQ
eukprot:UN07796